MHHIYQTEGIVAGGYNTGDANRKIFLFTKEMGVITAAVQSGRQAKSKLRPAIQDFTFGEYSLVRGKNEWKLVGARVFYNAFYGIFPSLEKAEMLGNVLALIKRLMLESSESIGIFDLVKEFVFELPAISDKELNLVEYLVLLRILNKLGFLRADPDLAVCIEESGFTRATLSLVSAHRRKTIKLINESLRAALSHDK